MFKSVLTLSLAAALAAPTLASAQTERQRIDTIVPLNANGKTAEVSSRA